MRLTLDEILELSLQRFAAEKYWPAVRGDWERQMEQAKTMPTGLIVKDDDLPPAHVARLEDVHFDASQSFRERPGIKANA